MQRAQPPEEAAANLSTGEVNARLANATGGCRRPALSETGMAAHPHRSRSERSKRKRLLYRRTVPFSAYAKQAGATVKLQLTAINNNDGK